MAYGIEGGSWDAVEHNITIPRLRALRDHWQQHPRVEWLAAAYLKYKPPSPPITTLKKLPTKAAVAPPPAKDANELARVMSAFGLRPGKTVTR